jgi:predicted HicB family RNase H-like nuclease
MATPRKPMTFNVAPPKVDAERRKQVGARVREATYRQLKSRAALTGASVQDLVEQAISDFLAKPE